MLGSLTIVLVLSVLPIGLVLAAHVALLVYACAIAWLTFDGLARGRDRAIVRWTGGWNARVCCVASQRLLHRAGLYDALMHRLATQRLRSLTRGGRVCLYGDSFFALWNGLETHFARRGVRAANAGFGGATSDQLRHFADVLVRRMGDEVGLVVLHVGGNDYDLGMRDVRRVSENVRRIAQRAAACPVVFLHGPRPPGFSRAKWAWTLELRHAVDVPVVDASHVDLAYHVDGVHPVGPREALVDAICAAVRAPPRPTPRRGA